MNWKIISRFGTYAALVLIGMGLLSFLLLGTSQENYNIGEIIGYSSIVIALVFVYFGIKNYRDKHLNGNISFWKGIQIGLLIALFPALAFALYNLVYVEIIDTEFMNNYYKHQISEMKVNLSAEEFLVAKAQMENEKELFMNTGFNTLIMFLTVWIIGLIVSILSSLVLQKTKAKNTV